MPLACVSSSYLHSFALSACPCTPVSPWVPSQEGGSVRKLESGLSLAAMLAEEALLMEGTAPVSLPDPCAWENHEQCCHVDHLERADSCHVHTQGPSVLSRGGHSLWKHLPHFDHQSLLPLDDKLSTPVNKQIDTFCFNI